MGTWVKRLTTLVATERFYGFVLAEHLEKPKPNSVSGKAGRSWPHVGFVHFLDCSKIWFSSPIQVNWLFFCNRCRKGSITGGMLKAQDTWLMISNQEQMSVIEQGGDVDDAIPATDIKPLHSLEEWLLHGVTHSKESSMHLPIVLLCMCAMILSYLWV